MREKEVSETTISLLLRISDLWEKTCTEHKIFLYTYKVSLCSILNIIITLINEEVEEIREGSLEEVMTELP